VNFFYSKIFRGFIEEDLLLFDLDSWKETHGG
jgi:hypothetical protein